MDSTALHTQYLDYIQLSSGVIEASQAKLASVQAQTDKARELIPNAVRLMLATPELGVGKEAEQFAATKLASHDGALEVLTNVLGLFNARSQADDLGGPDSQAKRASDSSPFVGQYSQQRREADQALEQLVFGGRR